MTSVQFAYLIGYKIFNSWLLIQCHKVEFFSQSVVSD